MKKMIERYRKLISSVLWEYEPVEIQSYVPEITDFHYRNGYINRYFVRRANDPNGIVYEVDTSNYSLYTNSPRFVATRIVWRISNDTVDRIKQFNRNSIQNGKKDISNLHLYLVHLDQFYKEVDF